MTDLKIAIFWMFLRSVSGPSLTLVKLIRWRWTMMRWGGANRSSLTSEQFSIVTRDALPRILLRPFLNTFSIDTILPSSTTKQFTSEQERFICCIVNTKCVFSSMADIVIIVLRSFMMLGEHWQEAVVFFMCFFSIISPCACDTIWINKQVVLQFYCKALSPVMNLSLIRKSKSVFLDRLWSGDDIGHLLPHNLSELKKNVQQKSFSM